MEGDRDKLMNVGESVSSAVQIMLVDISSLIQNSAKINAPYKTGNLRRSISTQFNKIQQGTVIVGSPVKYAKIREYSNNLHPRTTRYLLRGYTDNENEIKDIMAKHLSNELNK